jgi:hypothetical protein
MPDEAMGSIDLNFEILLNKTNPLEAQLAAARGLEAKMYAGGWVTPVGENPVVKEILAETLQRLEKHSQTVRDASRIVPGPVAEILFGVRDTLEFVREIIPELNLLVAGAQPDAQGNLPPGTDLTQFNDGKEPPDPDIKASRAVNGLFPHFPPLGGCVERSFPLAVECGGCGVVIKEFRGLQLRLVLRLVRIWVEPWFSRRRIINTWVWVIEWVPVEVIKTISVKCGCDDGGTKVTKTTVLDRELISFWRCL